MPEKVDVNALITTTDAPYLPFQTTERKPFISSHFSGQRSCGFRLPGQVEAGHSSVREGLPCQMFGRVEIF